MSEMTADGAWQRLAEVIARGAPAQAELARDIQRRWEVLGQDDLPTDLAQEIALVFNAYLHDPYLTRREPHS
jgi:hypothetical protein